MPFEKPEGMELSPAGSHCEVTGMRKPGWIVGRPDGGETGGLKS